MSVNSEASQNSSGAEGGQGQGGGEGSADISQILEQHRQALEQQTSLFGQSQNEIKTLKDQNAATQAVLDRIKNAVGGGKAEDAAEADPFAAQIQHYTGLIDEYLGAAIEHERQGKPIPLTVKNAIESFQGHIKQLELNRSMSAELAKLKQQVAKATDPSHAIDQQAYGNIDSFVISGLDTVYGHGDQMEEVKTAQFRTVTQQITNEVKRLHKEDPDMWDRIRRNPADQRKLVNHFIKLSVPPRARELMEEDQIRKTPVTLPMLQEAWQESKEIKDPAQRAKIQSVLRHQILEATVMKGRGGGSINNLNRG